MKKTIFDVLEKTPDGIDESTITPAYETDPERVIENVHRKLSEDTKKGGKKSMKKTRRKLPVILAAAVISALAAGTITVGALGGINSLIGEHSAGEMVNNLYPGSDVNLSVADGFKGEFMGIAGDDTNMVSLLRITNADGSDIIEPGKDAFIETNNYYQYYDKTCRQFDEEVLDIDPDKEISVDNIPTVKAKIWHSVGYDITDTTGSEFDNDEKAKISHSIWFRDPFDTSYACFADYEMADSKTINCYLRSHIDSGLFQSLKGETMKAEDKNLFIYQIDKVIFHADNVEDYARFVGNYKKLNSAISDNIGTLGDDQVITFHDYSMVVATKKEINVYYDLSVKLNYKSNTKQLSPVSDSFKGENGIDYTISSITAGSLSTDLKLDFTVPEGNDEYETFSGLMSAEPEVKITLTNGKIISAKINLNHNYEEHHVVTLTYCNTADENVSKWVIIDPSEISSITIDGNIITE